MIDSLNSLKQFVNMKNSLQVRLYLDQNPSLQTVLNVYTPESVYRTNKTKSAAILFDTPVNKVSKKVRSITHNVQKAIRYARFAERALFWKHDLYTLDSNAEWVPVNWTDLCCVINCLTSAYSESHPSDTRINTQRLVAHK